jgi:Complex I intermediate-associated protein 30 (CIA30)
MFGGMLSLENNGGFSTFRSGDLKLDLGSHLGLLLRVKGDGRTYQVRLATDALFRGMEVSFAAEISTIKSMDVIIPVKRGETRAELTVRTVARPERPVAELLTRLDLELPTRNRILSEIPAAAATTGPA